MLLGNCINGVSLSLNAMLTSVIESSREIELLLSFGANSYEASSRLLKEAIRTGSMPQLSRYVNVNECGVNMKWQSENKMMDLTLIFVWIFDK